MRARRKSEYHAATLALPIGVDRLWAAMQSLDREAAWSVQDVAHRAKTEPDHVRPYVRGLRTAGYVELHAQMRAEGRTTPFYRLAKPSREAPRVRPDGRELPELGREVIWRQIKFLGRGFTISELARSAIEVAPSRVTAATVKRYVLELARVGILQSAQRDAGTHYHLPQSLGAAAPRILQAHVVFDPNAGQVVGVADARDAL
ncbi:hypothetical protein [Methylopila sp. M107]|uniref:hypothetical protein n=1 Tax=Methylopila sp. M107 TaxID=1101190 RepID=UPI00036CDFFB|nr:hypothetical protein [Methylopila sp. M107]